MSGNPKCEHCEVPLAWHDQTYIGQRCNLNRAMSDLWRAIRSALHF
jgi:hypothetical protein